MRTAARALLATAAVLLPAAAVEASGGTIAFVSDRSGHDALWAVDGDGTGLRALTDARTYVPPRPLWLPEANDHDGPATWSPDGRRLAFAGVRAPLRSAIFVVDAEGGAPPERVTSPPPRTFEYEPAWSPDGRFLAFLRSPVKHHTAVLTLDLQTGVEHHVVATTHVRPSWSADGRRLLAYDGPGQRWITAAPDGSDVRAVSERNGRLGDSGSWSPVGRRLAFPMGSSVLLIDEDGRRPRELRLAARGVSVSTPVWSPDACWLAYTTVDPRTDGAPTELRVRPTRRGRPRVLARFTHYVRTPAWSSDGKHIALSAYDGRSMPSWRDERHDLIVVPFEGGAPRLLTGAPEVENHSPAWRPDPQGQPGPGLRDGIRTYERRQDEVRRRWDGPCRSDVRRTPAPTPGTAGR